MVTRFLSPGQAFLDEHSPVPIDAPFRGVDTTLDPRQLALLVDQGLLRRPLHGVYVATQLADAIELRADALRLVLVPGTVVTDRTAAWLHGVDVLQPGEHLEVPPVQAFRTVPGNRLRRPEVISGERRISDDDLTEVHGIPVTTMLRTACDLGRLQHRDRAFASLDAMVRAGVDPDALMAKVADFKGYRGVRQLRMFAPLADPRAESMAESITRLRWYDSPCPPPEPQRPVEGPNEELALLDLGIDALYFAVEYDGAAHHTDEDDVTHDLNRRGWIEEFTPWQVRVVTRANIFGKHQDFQAKLPGWIAEARRTLPARLARCAWSA